MADKSRKTIQRLSWLLIPAILMACSLVGSKGTSPTPPAEVAPSPTPTTGGTGISEENPCEGLSGSLEMQILVGPSDAVGLEPVAIGDLPFSVRKEGESYPVQGGGNLQYQDMLSADWGTYTVRMDMLAEISGMCVAEAGEGRLDLTVRAQGEQLVEVEADGFQGEYPWEGERQLDLAFPLQDGAQAEGEGWVFILHLD